jgi:NADH dehydrogenase FAD-containing subunit
MEIPTNTDGPLVVVVGGGFGGLAVVRALKRAKARVILISKANHFLFQPLLYQVATSMLGPADIITPLRQTLSKQRNVTVGLGEVVGVDLATRHVLLDYLNHRAEPLNFDYLVFATGASHNYFGHEEFAPFAPGLKEAINATTIRDRILRAFEYAEMEDDPAKHRDLLTFILVGGGPTGVELAGAIAELRRYTLSSDFRRVKPDTARIILVQSGPRILPSFHEDLAKSAHQHLEKMGVEIRTGAKVTQVDAQGVFVNGERIPSRTVVWTAGVTPSPVGKWLGVPVEKGRVKVDSHCEVPGHPGIFVLGDTAAFDMGGDKFLPGVAPVAIQQGNHVGRVISARLAGTPPPPAFRYFDKGNLAVIGKKFAILEFGKLRMAGGVAFLVWAVIHLIFLGSPGNRFRVAGQWLWSFVSGQRGSRLIMGSGGSVPLIDP